MADIRRQTEFVFGGKNFQMRFEGNPIRRVRELFQKNSQTAGRKMQEVILWTIKDRHMSGEPGTSYSRQYAKRKTLYATNAPRRPYRAGQSKDFEWSGQLHDAMQARLKLNQDRTRFTIWIGFNPNRRTPIQRTPGSNPNRVRTLTNQNLARHLNATHQGSQGKPFGLHETERARVLRIVADELTSP